MICTRKRCHINKRFNIPAVSIYQKKNCFAKKDCCPSEKPKHQFVQLNEDCHYNFKCVGGVPICCVCGDTLIFVGEGGISSSIGIDKQIYLDGKSLRKEIRVKSCHIPPVPTSQNKNDYTLWKSLMDDFLPSEPLTGDCCTSILGAIDIFEIVLNAQIATDPDFLPEGDALIDFINDVSGYKDQFNCS